jgi:hypothetical protein
MELEEFKGLIRYRDGGTMVLEAPDLLRSSDQAVIQLFNPLEMKKSSARLEFILGDAVLDAKRDEQSGSRLIEARIERVDQKQGRAVLRLRIVDARVLDGGDSGGGLWFQGEFLGNVWTTVIMKDTDTGAEYPTDMGVAAIFPAEYAGQADNR